MLCFVALSQMLAVIRPTFGPFMLSNLQLGSAGEKVLAMINNPYQLPMQEFGADNCLLAHEFSNDLTVILRQCDLLIELLASNSEAGKHLRLVRQAAIHMTERIVDPCQFAQTPHSFRPGSDLHHLKMNGDPFGTGSMAAVPLIDGLA